MRRLGRRFALCCLAALLLAGTALADSGPKPQLAVRMVNGPGELYYLDILAEGEFEDAERSFDGIEWSYSDEEAAALDQKLLAALRNAVPQGWHACTAEGSTGAPMWGDLAGENGLHIFGYHGVPETYRVLVVTASGEVWTSEVLHRRALQGSVTVDWAAKTAAAPPVWWGYVLQFLATLLPTLVIEGLLLLAFRFSWSQNWKAFLLVNLATQGALAVFLSFHIVQDGLGWWFFILMVPVEAVIAFAEAGLYTRLLKGRSKSRAFAYGLAANAASALLGWFLAEPVWRWVASIS